ncbi:MAG: HEAT repeat domain-containing protein, partial [Desulfobacterales bacterium]
MAQDETKSAEKSKGKENNVHRPRFDKKRLSDVLYHLNITRKNFLIYPPEHAQTKESIKKCHVLLCDLLEMAPKMTIGVAKDKLFVGNTLVGDKGPIIKELALALKNHELAGISFYQEISIDDLSCFFQLMARVPEEIGNLGGFDKALADNNIRTIKLQYIDYSKFHHMEETEIIGTNNGTSQAQGSTIWTDFISALLSGSLTASDQGMALEQARGIDPSQLALFLNENKINFEFALDTYRTTISNCIQKAGECIASPTILANDFCEMELLLHELSPKLKKQFLLATYNQLNSAGENEASKSLLNEFSEQVILDMLRQASESGEEISPSLMKFVNKITSAHDEMDHSEEEISASESINPLNLASDAGPLQNIFAREKFEEYVTTDYENTLNNLSGPIDEKIVEANKVLPIEDFHKELEPSHVDSQIAHIILAFMRNDIKPDEYETYSAKLVDIAYDLLRAGEFSTVLKIFKASFGHYKNKANPEIQSLAKNTLKTFHGARFVSMAVVSFEKWAKPDDLAAYEFLQSFGSIIIPELVGVFGKAERPEIQDLILKLLIRFPEVTCLEAKRRFSDHRPSFVLNMLTLVRKLGTEKDTPILRRLLKHHDVDIRTTVLETLIELKDPEGSDVIRDFLRSIDPK